MQKTIAVVGGTGMLGQPVAHCLKEAGFQVRIITRDAAKARTLFDDSFEMVTGVPCDSHRMQEALQDCSGVHINLPNQVEQQAAETIAQVAARLGLERISYISGATVAEEHRWFPYFNRKFLAEQAIRESGIPFTIFCPTWFMESLPLFVVNGRASVLGKQPCPYHWVAADDYAQMVATAYGQEEASNQRVVVLGPEAIEMHEALRRYCAVFHPDIKQVGTRTMPFWLVRLLSALTRNHELKAVGELMAYFDKVGEGNAVANGTHTLGTPTTTLAQWLEQRQASHSATPQISCVSQPTVSR
ncbi:MAG: NmrA family NAD(P)-binding protein [Chloroflexi bacterium]|nr:NmrA family NAD(P)-binding protein [Chloroflexota bacterium]